MPSGHFSAWRKERSRRPPRQFCAPTSLETLLRLWLYLQARNWLVPIWWRWNHNFTTLFFERKTNLFLLLSCRYDQIRTRLRYYFSLCERLPLCKVVLRYLWRKLSASVAGRQTDNPLFVVICTQTISPQKWCLFDSVVSGQWCFSTFRKVSSAKSKFSSSLLTTTAAKEAYYQISSGWSRFSAVLSYPHFPPALLILCNGTAIAPDLFPVIRSDALVFTVAYYSKEHLLHISLVLFSQTSRDGEADSYADLSTVQLPEHLGGKIILYIYVTMHVLFGTTYASVSYFHD